MNSNYQCLRIVLRNLECSFILCRSKNMIMPCQNNYEQDSFCQFLLQTQTKKTEKNSDNVKWYKLMHDIG